jgi:hypothetical protein
MKSLSVKTFFFLIFLSAKSFALKAELAHWFPWGIIQQEIATSISFSSIEKRDLALQWNDWTPKISGLKIDFNPGQVSTRLDSQGFSASYGSAESPAAVEILIGRFALDQIIYREFGGNKIGIRIKAQCEPFRIKIPAMSLTVLAPFELQGDFALPKVSDVNIAYGDKLFIEPVQCFGPLGFDDRITDLLRETLKDTQLLSQFIKDQLLQLNSEKVTDLFKKWLDTKGINAELLGTSKPLKDGLYIRLLSDLSTHSTDEKMDLDLNLLTIAPPRPEEIQTVLSKEQMNRLVELEISNRQIKNYNLQNIPSFASFMRNRFLQFFVWSDLLHYSRKAPFFLNALRIENVKLTEGSSGNWNLQMVAEGNIESERKGQKWNFINWSMGVSSQLTLEISSGQALVKTKNSLSNFNFSYGAEYSERFSPGRPSQKILQKAVQSALESFNFNLQLPQVMVGSSVWKMNSWSSESDRVFIEWAQ